MQRLFAMSGRLSPELSNMWAAITAREFYDGDLEFDTSSTAHFTFEKALCYPVALTKLTSSSVIAYHRTWKHIRKNNVGFRVIWFVRRGSLRLVRSQGSCEVNAGEAAILDSSAPFHAKVIPDENGQYESFQLTVPAYLFLAHLQDVDKAAEPFSIATTEGQVVLSLLDLLVRDGDNMSRRAAKPLTESLLQAVADCMGHLGEGGPRRQRLVDKRLADIENYILMNLTDPDLCYDRVAANCGISPRYLCYVLKANNTSFSELLWKNRLPKARDLLTSPATRDYPIHEIAYMSGFKSAAHFSRMFKAEYGCPPRKFRMSGEPGTLEEMASGCADDPHVERMAA